MTKEAKIKLLENRIKVLEANDKDNAGVVRSLKRELRNLIANA